MVIESGERQIVQHRDLVSNYKYSDLKATFSCHKAIASTVQLSTYTEPLSKYLIPY